jgi:hypothetical protein
MLHGVSRVRWEQSRAKSACPICRSPSEADAGSGSGCGHATALCFAGDPRVDALMGLPAFRTLSRPVKIVWTVPGVHVWDSPDGRRGPGRRARGARKCTASEASAHVGNQLQVLSRRSGRVGGEHGSKCGCGSKNANAERRSDTTDASVRGRCRYHECAHYSDSPLVLPA